MAHMITRMTAALFLTCTAGFAAHLDDQTANPKEIQVVPVDPSPDPNEVETKILYPKQNELRKSSPIKGQIQVEGVALGVDTEMPRRKDIWNDPEGQSIHVFIDNQPYFSLNEALIDALDDIGNYYDQTAEYEIPFKLQPGMHIIRAFPVRSFNESYKSDRAFTSSVFYYQEKKGNPQIDLSKPFLTYNEPQGEYDYNKNNPQPILLDFYVTNCSLSRDGYKVRLTIDNDNQRILTAWQPYYIYGLKKGMHRIRLELLNPQNKTVNGMFNDVQRTIVIK
ncbi:MAG: hypothetical protein HYX67_14675 [Candidatus Melainabacteria bacterium]|nr:hypothetical protein [Candidatus Melainabacteria bacterium]